MIRHYVISLAMAPGINWRQDLSAQPHHIAVVLAGWLESDLLDQNS